MVAGPKIACVVASLFVASCGSSTSAPPTTAEVALVPPPAAAAASAPAAKNEVPPLALSDDGGCPSPLKCRFEAQGLTAILKVRAAESIVRVEYGGTAGVVGDKLRPDVDTLLPQLEGRLDELGRDQAKVRVPLTVHFADGRRAEGHLAIGGMTLRVLLDERLRAAEKGPVVLPNDGPAPADGKPRAMWVVGGQTSAILRGDAKTAAEIDWLLVVDDVSRPATCARNGGKTSISDTRGRVYERRTGKLVGQEVFPSHADPCGDDRLGIRDAEKPAGWAWGKLRDAAR